MSAPQQMQQVMLSALTEYNKLTLLARASELGYAGRLLEAEALLDNHLLLSDWRVLDLQARVYVKQRRYAEAMRRWCEASRLTSHSKFDTEIHALEYIVNKEHLHLSMLKWLSLIVTTALLAALFIVICRFVILINIS